MDHHPAESRDSPAVGAPTPSQMSAAGIDYSWAHQFLHDTTSIHFNLGQVEEIIEFAEEKLHRLIDVAQDVAVANSRRVVFRWDLPLTRGLQNTVRQHRHASHDISAAGVESHLRTVGITSTLDIEVRELLPHLFGALLVLTGRTVSLMTPRGMTPEERLAWLTTPDDHMDVTRELDRAREIVDAIL